MVGSGIANLIIEIINYIILEFISLQGLNNYKTVVFSTGNFHQQKAKLTTTTSKTTNTTTTTTYLSTQMDKGGVNKVVNSLEHQAAAKGHLVREGEHHAAAELHGNIAKNPNVPAGERAKAGLAMVGDKMKETGEAAARKLEEMRS